jgi:hypothetical protein
VALLVAPLALVATGAWMRTAHGPSWLAFNFDPTYAYLLNSLSILGGYPPYLIQHPGVPLQAIGSLVLVLRHAADGDGTIAHDVIARPEAFVEAIYWTSLVVSSALLAAAGAVVWRRAGLGAALLAQRGRAVGDPAAIMDRCAEVLIIGVSALWAACRRPRRTTGAIDGAVARCADRRSQGPSALPPAVAPRSPRRKT